MKVLIFFEEMKNKVQALEFLERICKDLPLYRLVQDLNEEEADKLLALREDNDPEVMIRLKEIEKETLQELNILNKWADWSQVGVEFDPENGTAKLVKKPESLA